MGPYDGTCTQRNVLQYACGLPLNILCNNPVTTHFYLQKVNQNTVVTAFAAANTVILIATGIVISERPGMASPNYPQFCLKDTHRGGKSCVAGGPNEQSCTNKQHTEDVSFHYFPKNPDVRKKWVKFVQKHRQGWKPTDTSVLCSAHFEDDCFTTNRRISRELNMKSWLKRGAVPTIDIAGGVSSGTGSLTERRRRQVSFNLNPQLNILSQLLVTPARKQQTVCTINSVRIILITDFLFRHLYFARFDVISLYLALQKIRMSTLSK